MAYESPHEVDSPRYIQWSQMHIECGHLCSYLFARRMSKRYMFAIESRVALAPILTVNGNKSRIHRMDIQKVLEM
jgi:hypothetical protein